MKNEKLKMSAAAFAFLVSSLLLASCSMYDNYSEDAFDEYYGIGLAEESESISSEADISSSSDDKDESSTSVENFSAATSEEKSSSSEETAASSSSGKSDTTYVVIVNPVSSAASSSSAESSSSSDEVVPQSSVTTESSSSLTNSSSSAKESSSSATNSSSSAKESSSSVTSSSSSAEESSNSVESSSSFNCSGVIEDARDENEYEIGLIGNTAENRRCWLLENMRYKVSKSTTACYENDDSNCETYGRLYQFLSAKNACPDGWRLPTKKEFETLDSLTGQSVSNPGSYLKSSGWTPYSGNNQYGFNALPAGMKDDAGSFTSLGDWTGFWTSEQARDDAANMAYLTSSDNALNFGEFEVEYFLSVRCVKE